jgi:hypothetical protein
MKKLNVLKYLERKDKWYLGGGNRLIWIPPFPVWLDYPGFWDKAHYYNYEIEPVFTWTILDEDGNEIPIRSVERQWNPSKLTTSYEMEDVGYASLRSQIANLKSALSITEDKCCLPNDVLSSVVRMKNSSKKTIKLNFITWTIQPNYQAKKMGEVAGIKVERSEIAFTKKIYRPNAPILPIECRFGINCKMESYSINLSEGQTIQPHWKFTPFYEKFKNGKLQNEIKLAGVDKDGLIFIALHKKIILGAKQEESISVLFSAAPTRKESENNFASAARLKNPIEVSIKNWNDYFATVPHFECSDEYFTRYYWYRWYGLRLMSMHGKEGNYKYPLVCEGLGYFRAPISYSATCHMLENRWRINPKLAQGSLLTFIENQRKDGGFRGYIDVNYYRQEMFYHANWGNSVRELYHIHPDKKFLKTAYDGLVKYARYFDRERDAEGSGLYDIDNHYETGQEFMHRYLAVDSGADKDNWGKVFRLKGVDVTVYIYELKRSLAWMAKELHHVKAEIAEWDDGYEKIKHAVLEKMWDPKKEMFFDVNPLTGKQTKIKTAVCFYPYMTDIVSETHLKGLKKHLLNPEEFWTMFPVASSSVDDEYFSAEAEWKGKRMNCPWNGRVWPMTNSHITEVLAQSAIRFDDNELRARSVEFVVKFIQMMFFDNDAKRPNCFEHYNPLTGDPSVYRGVDDYQHSWVNDLILKYIGGIRPFEESIVIDPFPFPLDKIVIDNLFINGKEIKIKIKPKSVQIWLNNKKYNVKRSVSGS